MSWGNNYVYGKNKKSKHTEFSIIKRGFKASNDVRLSLLNVVSREILYVEKFRHIYTCVILSHYICLFYMTFLLLFSSDQRVIPTLFLNI